MAFEYGLIGAGEDVPAISELLSWSFGFPLEAAEPWLRLAGFEHVRVLREGKTPVAAAFLIPMGQFFGGQSVSMMGVAGVATAPERRGTGAALAMMRAMMQELRKAGWALSTLYPATRPLYRGAGYEVAGTASLLEVPARRLRGRERNLTVRPANEGDFDAMATLYRAHAAASSGHLDRGPYIWNRVRNPRGERARGFVIERSGVMEGYVYLFERQAPNLFYDVHLTDGVASTPEAARALLAFLGHHSTLGQTVTWRTGPVDPLVLMLPEIEYVVRHSDHWMVRVVDVRRALTERGYPQGIETEVHFDVRDDLIAENQGRFVLSVAGGKGHVRKGGKGRIKLDIKGLAPLFTGHSTPRAITLAGLAEGPDAELARAALAFSGPAPWMADRF